MKMNILFSFSGLFFCLIQFSQAQLNVSDETRTINAASWCSLYDGRVDLQDLSGAFLQYQSFYLYSCEILLANRPSQYVVFSFYEWDLTENDELTIRDNYTELSLTGKIPWYGDKTFIFRGPTTIQFTPNETFSGMFIKKFKFLFTISNGDFPCEKSDFKCNNKICLNSRYLVCDGNNNCGDWTDEMDCHRTCTDDEFHCSNTKCIPLNKLCNGNNDCGDMSDEHLCNRACNPYEPYKCDNGICISNDLVCNNKNDCGDWSEEKNCHRLCDIYDFPCSNGRCLQFSKVCDGHDDCGDRSDEKKCWACSSTEHSCPNGLCIPKSFVCNNHSDCGDFSDEKGCNTAKREIGDETKWTVAKVNNPWLIAIIVCAALLAIVIITFSAILIRNKMKNKKEPTTPQNPNVPTNTNAHNLQPSNIFGHIRQSFRSERPYGPSTVQQPPAFSEPQAYQMPSIYPQLHSNTEIRHAHQVPPTNFFDRVRQSFRSRHQPTPSTDQPPGYNELPLVASGTQTYQVPSIYPHLQSGVDNPEFRAEE